MCKKISFKMFCSVVWRGLCQGVTAFLKLFGYQGTGTLSKVMWRITSTCIAIIMLMVVFCVMCAFWEDVIYRRYVRPFFTEETYTESNVSSDVVFKYNYYTDRGYIYNDSTGRKTITNVNWICENVGEDSLAVYSQDGKRGYFNIYTGAVVVPAQYSKAWIFSEGLAAVESGKKIVFINKAGEVVIDNNLVFNEDIRDYVFKKGYCVVSRKNDKKMGMIDRNGNWALLPHYDEIVREYDFWKVVKDGYQGLLSDNLDTVYSASYPYIDVERNYIELHTKDTCVVQVDYNGYVIAENVINEVSTMEYETNEIIQEFDEDGDFMWQNKKGITKCKKYYVYWNHRYLCGLIDAEGHIVTPAIYNQIEAVGEDLYLCHPQGIIINGKGER